MSVLLAAAAGNLARSGEFLSYDSPPRCLALPSQQGPFPVLFAIYKENRDVMADTPPSRIFLMRQDSKKLGEFLDKWNGETEKDS